MKPVSEMNAEEFEIELNRCIDAWSEGSTAFDWPAGWNLERANAVTKEILAIRLERDAALDTIRGYLDILVPTDYSKGVRQASRGIKAAMELARSSGIGGER